MGGPGGAGFVDCPKSPERPRRKAGFPAKGRPARTVCHEEGAGDAQLFRIYPGTQGLRFGATWHPAVPSIPGPESRPGGAPQTPANTAFHCPYLAVATQLLK